MTNSRDRSLRHETWEAISAKFAKHHRLPKGTTIALNFPKSSLRPKGRKARSDWMFARHLFKGRARDHETISDLFANYLAPALLDDPRDKGFVFSLIGPDGETPQGNTKIRTVRSWNDAADEDDVWEASADEVAAELRAALRKVGHNRKPDVVAEGAVRALVEKYGREELLEMVESVAD